MSVTEVESSYRVTRSWGGVERQCYYPKTAHGRAGAHAQDAKFAKRQAKYDGDLMSRVFRKDGSVRGLVRCITHGNSGAVYHTVRIQITMAKVKYSSNLSLSHWGITGIITLIMRKLSKWYNFDRRNKVWNALETRLRSELT